MKTLPLATFESIAKQCFSKARVIDLSCGFEPFMTKNFVDYARIARKYARKAHIGVCTNALLMSDSVIADAVQEGLFDEIDISVDGVTKLTYESIRVGGDFSKLVHVLKQINAARKGKNGLLLRMNYTLLRRNVEELERVYQFVKENGISVLQLRHAKITKEFPHLIDESLFFHKDMSDDLIRKVKDTFSRDPTVSLIHPPLFSENDGSVASRASCAYAWFNFVINCSADINMCNIGKIGNFYESSFVGIMSSDLVKSIRARLLKGGCHDLCGNCHSVSDLGDVNDEATFVDISGIRSLCSGARS